MTVLWENACPYMREEMSAVAFDTWIRKGLKPLDLNGSELLLEALDEYNNISCSFVSKRYGALINMALSRAAGTPMTARIITPQDAEEYREGQRLRQGAAENLPLNPRYTFDTFVVGNGNRFAHAASLAVAESPADAYNPLFIYGDVGLGKTHLMNAIGHYILSENPDTKLAYVTSEGFTNELIGAIQRKCTAAFREKYRNVDVLMVDDIQFIAGLDRTQEEFFHTFNTLQTARKQIIISSDKPPKEIAKLENRLRSRFECGLIADIQKPDMETRMAILKKKSRDDMILINDDVLLLIAERIDSNIRELEGCLTRLNAYAALTGQPIDIAMAEEALREVFVFHETRHVNMDDVLNAVTGYYGVTPDDLKGPRRNREVAVPRQVFMYLARELTDLSLTRVGDYLGRDHTTVLHGCEKMAQMVKENGMLASAIEDLTKRLQEKA